MGKSVMAQTSDPAPNSAQQVFTAADFTDFQPQTAADMVQRIPGFSIRGNEGGERGFGQASLNLLIDGQRPSSKSSSANEILRRIPASNVVRIELLDGASLDIPGLSGQVANIITKAKSNKLSGNWDYAARFARDTEPQLLEGSVSVSGERGDLSFVAGLDFGQFTFTERGTETFADGTGTVFEDRREQPFFATTRPRASLNLTWTPQEGHTANVNLSGEVRNRRNGVFEQFTAVTADGITGESEITGGEDEYNYEIGGDYSLPAFGGTAKLIGLYRFEESDFSTRLLFNEFGQTPLRTVFERLDDEIEAIVRTEFNISPAKGHDIQFSVEGALNVLDSETLLTATGETDSTENVRVEEDRAEANVTHSWTLSDKVSLQSSLGVEYSKLDVVSSTEPAREFVRPKGFISASYAPNSEYTWRVKFEREVGQLNFGTFVSRVNLGDNFTNSGNSKIVPSQNWRGELELERKVTDGLSGTVTIFAEHIDDPIDQIRFINGPADPDDDTEGPGNLDSASRYGIDVNGTWLLDKAGFKGGRLQIGAGARDSNIEDPLTGETRKINQTMNYYYNATLRHDIPKTDYAWFVFAELDEQSPFFRLDQVTDVRRDKPTIEVGVEHKNFLGMRLKLQAENLLNWDVIRDRDIYDTDRLGTVIQREQFRRSRGRRFSIELSDTF